MFSVRSCFAVIALLVACLLPARALQAAPAPLDGATAPAPGTAVPVGLLAAFPPLHSWPAGATEPQGLDVDLLSAVAGATGLRFTFRRYADFESLLRALNAGEVRVVTAIAQTPDRALHLRFTQPYASVQQAFVGPSTITSVPATPDLSGRRLAVTRGHVAETIAFERFPGAARPAYPTVEAAFDAVRRGDADFVLEALPTLRHLVRAQPDAGLTVLRTYGFPEGHLRLATRLQDGPLAARIDAALQAMPAPLMRDLHGRWVAPLTPAAAPAAARPVDEAIAPLRVGYLPADPPYSMREADGTAGGIAVALMRATAHRAGVRIADFEPHDLASGLDALASGRLDVMLGLTDIAERRARMSFIGPYRANPLVLVSRKVDPVWGLHQLAGRRLAMPRGYFGAPYIRAVEPTIELVACLRVDDCLTAVDNGDADAVLYGLQGSYARLERRAGTGLHVSGTVAGLYDEHNMGLSRQRAALGPLLRDALNDALLADLPAIERAQAERVDAPQVDWARVQLALAAAAVALLALAGAWWWHSRTLRAEIARTSAARRDTERYLAFMAHEVRNSLQAVSGAVALLGGSRTPAPPDRPVLDALGRSTAATLALLNGLLDRHRLQEGRLSLRLQADSPERALRSVIDEMRPAAQAKGLTLDFEREPSLDGRWLLDALRLQTIVRNLLVNAVKFTDRGGVAVRAALLPGPGEAGSKRLRVEVADTGPGIAPAVRERLFTPFLSEGGDRPGSGLGLALCRDLARALGGDLTVQAGAPSGSVFVLTCDIQAAGADDAPGRRPVTRLLVIEDSPVYALLLRQAFANRGVAVTLADSVDTARERLAAALGGGAGPPFDLVLSDLHLGDRLVDEVLAFLADAAHAAQPLPPVVVMSAEVDAATAARLAARGVAATLPKDADVAALAQRVLDAAAPHVPAR